MEKCGKVGCENTAYIPTDRYIKFKENGKYHRVLSDTNNIYLCGDCFSELSWFVNTKSERVKESQHSIQFPDSLEIKISQNNANFIRNMLFSTGSPKPQKKE